MDFQQEVVQELEKEVALLEARRARSTKLYEYEERSGRCINCDQHVSVMIHVMRDTDGTEWTARRRDSCFCD